jgi:hypothetical protein
LYRTTLKVLGEARFSLRELLRTERRQVTMPLVAPSNTTSRYGDVGARAGEVTLRATPVDVARGWVGKGQRPVAPPGQLSFEAVLNALRDEKMAKKDAKTASATSWAAKAVREKREAAEAAKAKAEGRTEGADGVGGGRDRMGSSLTGGGGGTFATGPTRRPSSKALSEGTRRSRKQLRGGGSGKSVMGGGGGGGTRPGEADRRDASDVGDGGGDDGDRRSRGGALSRRRDSGSGRPSIGGAARKYVA